MDADPNVRRESKNGGDGGEGLLIGVIVLLVVLFFLVVIFIAILITDRTDGGVPQVETETGAFLSSCVSTSCQSPLACDGNTFTCRLTADQPCNDGADCVTGLFCSGRCISGATGSLNQFCPCFEGYRCELDVDGYTRCKGISGTSCTIDSDCVSTICLPDQTCAAGAPDAYPCLTDDTCSSRNCSLGFCQPPGVTTGVLGAACAIADLNFCGVPGLTGGHTGASCNESTTNPLRCDCINGPGNAGVCIGANQGVLSTCSLPASGCGIELICLNATGPNISLECTEDTCICVFPYMNPNIPAEGECIGGMALSTIQPNPQTCYNEVGLGCAGPQMCTSGSCMGQSVMAIYTFDNVFDPMLYPGSLNTAITVGFPGPAGDIAPHKMFATSAGTSDTIYLVDGAQGFLQVPYDVTMTGVTPNWIPLIPSITTGSDGGVNFTRTLLDVGYNGITYLVAFDEVVTGAATGHNSTVYTWDGTPYPGAVFTPYNFVPGAGITGTQYTTNNQAITINYIDISPFNDGLTDPAVPDTGGDVLLVQMNTVYVKTAAGQRYSVASIAGGARHNQQMTNVAGMTRFYYDNIQETGSGGPPVCPENCTTDNQCPSDPIDCPSYYNIAFISTYPISSTQPIPNILQFSGNIASFVLPLDIFNQVTYQVFDFSIYSPTTAGMSGSTGMPGSALTILAHAYQGTQYITDVVAISYAGVTAIMPYHIDQNSRSVATANAYYILSPGSCS